MKSPNPVINSLKIQSEIFYDDAEIRIAKTFGQNIRTIKGFKGRTEIDFTTYNSGVYYISLYNQDKFVLITRIIKL